MAMTSYLQKKLGDIAIAKADWTMPIDVSLGLFAASPGAAGSLASEFTGTGYTRKALTAAMGAFDAVTGIATNTSAITFPVPASAWGLMLFGGIIDVSTLATGNVLYYTQWANARVINNGDIAVVIPVGAITIQIVGTTLAMISSYLMKKLGDKSIGKIDHTMPTKVYHGLLASDPTVAGVITSEVAVGGYTRQDLTTAMAAFDVTNGRASNTLPISYPTPTAAYPSVNFSFVSDAAAAGNLLFSNQLPSPLAVRNAGPPALFSAGSINFTFA